MADVHANKRVGGEDGPDLETVNLDLDGGMRLLGPRPAPVDAPGEPASALDTEESEPLAGADVLDGPAAIEGIDFSQIDYTVGDAAHVTISQAVSNLAAFQTQSVGQPKVPALPAPDDDTDPQLETADAPTGTDAPAAEAAALTEGSDSRPAELPEPEPDLDEVRARSDELAEIVRSAGPLRPTTPAAPGQVSHEHRSVLGLIRPERDSDS